MIHIDSILQYLNANGFDYRFEGDASSTITGFSSLAHYKRGNLTWVKKQQLFDDYEGDSITLLVAQDGVKAEAENIIYSEQSKAVFFSLLEHFFPSEEECPDVGIGTYISDKVKIGNGVKIGHNCTLDGDITIGDGTRLYNNVIIIHHAEIGANCEIQSGVNIGHDGFGYTEDDSHVKTMVKHYGGVSIGNNVYIGGNTYIERGTLDNTIIEDGVKIDGLCLIGHNSVLRKNTAVVAGSILLGSVTLEENAYIASALIRNQAHVGKNGFVGMGSVVTKNVDPDAVVVGVPARKIQK